MRPVYFYRILPLFAFYWWSSTLMAQVVSTNDEGRKVIVFSDGSWRYFQDEKTTVEPPQSLHPDSSEFAESLAEARDAAFVADQLLLELIQARVALARLSWETDSLQRSDEKPADDVLSEGRNKLKKLQSEIETLDFRYRLAKEWAALLEETAYYPLSVRREKLVEWQQSNGFAGGAELRPISPQSVQAPPVLMPFHFHRAPRPADNLELFPPPVPCELAYTGTDATTGLKRRDTRPSPFFSKTDKALRASFPESDFIRCSGYITAITGGLRFLHLEISIATPKAHELYGYFENGGSIDIRLLSGENVRLFNNHKDAGIWEPASQSTVYHLQFQIGGNEEKMLRQGEIDSVLLHWNQVKEEFEVYELDFFNQHFACLDHSK